nr:PREDICTED: nucleic-acid-binding protein from mobile element jockey-like isoform X1 [Bemisia tabaci]
MAGVGEKSTKSDDSSYDTVKNVVINELLSVDIEPVLKSDAVNDSIKAYISKSKSVVSVMDKENKVLANENSELNAKLKSLLEKFAENEQQNQQQQALISNLQVQINDLKQNITSKTGKVSNPVSQIQNVRSKDNSVKDITKNNPRKISVSGQLKLTQFTEVQKSKDLQSNSNSSAAVPTNNKFDVLNSEQPHQDEEMVTLEDDVNSAKDDSLSEDYNSDPEFRAKRQVYRQQRKKRKRGNSNEQDPQTSSSSKQLTNTDKSNPTDIINPSNKTKILPPPPIKVIGIKNYEEIKSILKAASPKEEYSIRFIGSETWKINPSSEESFRQISDNLNTNGIQWYSHANKNTRNIKVMCKGLPPSMPEEEIVQDLLDKNFKIKNAVCMRKRIIKSTQKPTSTDKPQDENSSSKKEIKEFELIKIPVHQLDFDYSESIEKIHSIKAIAHTMVKIEPIKINPTIVPQCKRCCGFQHTANFCAKTPRCVKCAGKHLSADCMYKGRISNPKCVNCGTIGHPASYRGCPFAKDFQIARKHLLKNKKNPENNEKNFPQLGIKTIKASKPKPLDKSFAQAVTGNKNNESSSQADIISTLLKTIEALNVQIQLLNEKIGRLEARSNK